MTGDSILAKLLEHNRLREARLRQYSAPRTYRVQNDKGKVPAEVQVVLHYRAPGAKEFKIVSEKGSGLIRSRVFKPLTESEVETAAGRNRHDSSISPNNYTFNLLGEEDVDGYHCFVVQATPKRNDTYLFTGKIWIHAAEFAVVQIAGQPAKKLSFWINRVDFVRRNQKIGEFWLPLKDESITQVKIAGKNILTVDYDHYEMLGAIDPLCCEPREIPMANTIKTGTILIREDALLPESLLIQSEPYAPGWGLVKQLDIDGMSQTIGKAGWAFLYMAGVIKTSVFGFDEEKTTRKAIKRVIEHMRSKKFNCLEITQVVAERFLWLPFVTVSARSRHIQESPVLFGD